MKFIKTSLGYLRWHYGKALIKAFALWKNILIFLFDYFSIKSLLGNFFTPWKRLANSYPKPFNFKNYLFTFIANTIMRIVGILLRSIVIILGVLVCLIYVAILPLTLILWLALPLIIIYLIVDGIVLIIFS